MKNIFLEKLCTKYGEETSFRPFFSKKTWEYLWINSLKFHTACFHCMSRSWTNKTYWNWGGNHWLLLYIKLFYKTEKGLQLVYLPHFLHDFEQNYLITLYSLDRPSFMIWLHLLFEIPGNMFIAIICVPLCDVIYLKFTVAFLSSGFPTNSKMSKLKCKYLRNENSFQDEIKTIIHHF